MNKINHFFVRFQGHVLHIYFRILRTYEQWFGSPQKARIALNATMIGAVLIVVIGIGILIKTSLPGNALYGLKTGFMEESISVLYVIQNAKANYRISLVENRLAETQKLGQKDGVSENELGRLHAETARDVEAFNAIIETSDTLELREVLTLMHRLSSVLRAQETVTERHGHLAVLEENVEDLRRESENLHEDIAELFVSSSDEAAIEQYVTDLLSTLTEAVSGRPVREELVDQTADHIGRISDAIAEDDAVEAIVVASEALQGIRVAAYLNELE